MMLPVIHMNGTSQETLVSAYAEALTAIEYAMDAIKETAPHNRDYYPRGRESWDQAIHEHRARFNDLARIAAELRALAEHCDSGPDNSIRDAGRDEYMIIGRPRDERF